MNAEPKNLSDLLIGIQDVQIHGDPHIAVNAIRYDSRQVQPGDLFVAIKGYTTDGHRYIPQALENGAIAVVYQGDWKPPSGVTGILVPSSRSALATLAWRFYDYPQRGSKLIGVTGTNGKTSVAHILWAIFQHARPPAGMIGTIENRIGSHSIPAVHTTPESVDVAELFAHMRREGVPVVSMEVSSHALVLDRVRGLDFAVAVFTNLSHEHLDFHHTIEEYRDAKAMLFEGLSPDAVAVLNGDDPVSEIYRSICPAKCWMYSLTNPDVDLFGFDLETDWDGTRLTIRTPVGEQRFETPLVGRFNASNLLAAVGAALALDLPLADIQGGLGALKPVPGRFERMPVEAPYTVVVDYAHTPDALDKCLRTARALPGKRLISVFGCGGDRDRKKRPLMGQIAQGHCDLVVITSDNPRTEDPQRIIDDIIAGMDAEENIITDVDRRSAIHRALSAAQPGDVIVVAGKGHETYQIIGDRTVPFDDHQVILDYCSRGVLQ